MELMQRIKLKFRLIYESNGLVYAVASWGQGINEYRILAAIGVNRPCQQLANHSNA